MIARIAAVCCHHATSPHSAAYSSCCCGCRTHHCAGGKLRLLRTDLPAAPQTLRFDGGLATLDGPWQFHLGDDSAWAAAGFDDSGWEQLDAGKPWGAQGHESVDGYAWYRRHVNLAPGENGAGATGDSDSCGRGRVRALLEWAVGGRLRNAAAASGVVLRHAAAYLGAGTGAIGSAGDSRVEGAVRLL